MILHLKQKEIVRSNARFKIVRGGRRAGKSICVIEEMLYCAMTQKDRYIFYIAPTQIQARDIIWESLKSRVAGLGKPNEARLEMRVPTQDGGESIIYIAGWENRENFRGKKAHLQVFDELDTMKNFFIGWQEIFRPALTDTQGKAIFIGTPKKENPNLRRLEKIALTDRDYEVFTFKTEDNPHIAKEEIEKARKEIDYNTFKQEYEAEYVDNQGSLFKYTSIVDIFSNTVDRGDKYLTVDIAGDGNDKTKISYWEGLCEVERRTYSGINTEIIISKIREISQDKRIPYSNIAVDAIGIGEGVASSSLLDGIIGYKSSYQAIKTDESIVLLPNVHYTKEPRLTSDYSNLRSQCIFKLAELVNTHKIASLVTGRDKENIIEELSLYQDASKGDGKRQATSKDDIKALLGRSPDDSDIFIIRCYFEIRDKMLPQKSSEVQEAVSKQLQHFTRNRGERENYSTR